jgi:hypothetical protein
VPFYFKTKRISTLLHTEVAKTAGRIFLMVIEIKLYCAGDKIEKNELGGACSTDGVGERPV